ncbi:hypothetical protein [Geobacter sp. OR-1]|uniref:hypothetical protein n=1 Tax=Geobacter sp. OR-1 TaxID=1266765 RepID=UPI0005AB1598|nr:hypothetical protein [Geobacter sp. OR-1]
MFRYLSLILCFLAGCTSFESAYNDVYRRLQSRDSEQCIEIANYHLKKGYFSNNEKVELYQLIGGCFQQIGFYDDALNSLVAAVNLSGDNVSKSKVLFQRALLYFAIDPGSNEKYTNVINSGCSDMAEACRLMPDKYCTEYSLKKYPPTNCR